MLLALQNTSRKVVRRVLKERIENVAEPVEVLLAAFGQLPAGRVSAIQSAISADITAYNTAIALIDGATDEADLKSKWTNTIVPQIGQEFAKALG